MKRFGSIPIYQEKLFARTFSYGRNVAFISPILSPLLLPRRYVSTTCIRSFVSSVRITCHPGLEPFLCQELKTILQHHGFSLQGNAVLVKNITPTQLMECCLKLGCATHIFVPLLDTPLQCRGFAEMERKLKQLPWNNWLLGYDATSKEDGPQIHVNVSSYKSRLYHTTAIAERVESIVHQVMDMPLSSKGPVIALQVQLFRDQLQLFLKARPFPFHKRGYRLEVGKAPLREDLAYAMLWSAGLHPSCSSVYNAVLDPFCGSGTLVLEAAAMVNGLPPGRLHDAPFQGTYLSDEKLWQNLKEHVYPSRPIRVAGSDRDAGVIQAAQANAVRAGVKDLVTLQHCAFSSHPWLDANSHDVPYPLLWVSNLPFGKRTTTGRAGRVPALLPLYQKLVQHMSQQRQCTALLLTDSPSLLKRSGVSDEKVIFDFSLRGIPVSVVRTKSCSSEPAVED